MRATARSRGSTSRPGLSTQDLDIWLERVDDPRVALAATDAGGFWIPGFGVQPPAFGGQGLGRLDVVRTATDSTRSTRSTRAPWGARSKASPSVSCRSNE